MPSVDKLQARRLHGIETRRLLFELSTVVALALLGLIMWAGQQRAPDTYLQKIESNRTLRVGIDPTYPPFDTLQNGEVRGYDAELARAIAADLGVQVEFHTLALDTLYDALAAGKVDVLISALPFVYERQTDVRYSTPYYQAGQALVVRPGKAGISTLADLRGKVVGVELGSNADTEARRLASTTVPEMQLRSIYRSPEEALSALSQGGLDAVITDNVSARLYLAGHPGSVSILSPTITNEPYVVAMPVRAIALSARIDATITRLRASGELARLMGEASAKQP